MISDNDEFILVQYQKFIHLLDKNGIELDKIPQKSELIGFIKNDQFYYTLTS